jgi:septum formation protein
LNYVLETASAKAHDVYKTEINNRERGEPAIVIAADTIVVSHAGKILEKPKSEADHIATLKMLRDEGEHKVMTAVAVMKPLESAVDPETTVKFDSTGTSSTLATIDLSANMHSYR